MSGDLLQRARLLRDCQRFDDAIAMLHGCLASEPESYPSVAGRIVFGLMTSGVVACGVMMLVLGQNDPEATAWGIVAMLVVLVTPRISMMPALREKKPG